MGNFGGKMDSTGYLGTHTYYTRIYQPPDTPAVVFAPVSSSDNPADMKIVTLLWTLP
jgi:hypothetical protein